jgi:hypothetical protein
MNFEYRNSKAGSVRFHDDVKFANYSSIPATINDPPTHNNTPFLKPSMVLAADDGARGPRQSKE